MVNLRAVWKHKVPSPKLVPLLAQHYRLTDPCDMEYGLQSLLHLNVDIDYNKTIREVYLDWHAGALEYCRARDLY